MGKLLISESNLKQIIRRLHEVNDWEYDIAELTDRVENMDVRLEDDLGRVGYIRQLTAELLEFLQVLSNEIDGQIKIPNSLELMNKIMGRTERKRYYMSKFRL